MSWHYALRKRTNRSTGDTWYDVVEVYDGIQYTEHGIRPGGETPDAVAKELTRMLADIQAHPVIDETEGNDGGQANGRVSIAMRDILVHYQDQANGPRDYARLLSSTPIPQLRWPDEERGTYSPLVPKKYLAGQRYRLKPSKMAAVQVDCHGIVDFEMIRSDWPPSRWLGFVMGYVADNDDEITWDAEAMAKRPKLIMPTLD